MNERTLLHALLTGLIRYLTKKAPIAPRTKRINGHSELATVLPVPGSMYARAEVE